MFMDQAPAIPCRHALIADEIAAAADAHAAPKRLGGLNQTTPHACPARRIGGRPPVGAPVTPGESEITNNYK